MDTPTLQNAVTTYIEAFDKADLNIIANLYAENATDRKSVV